MPNQHSKGSAVKSSASGARNRAKGEKIDDGKPAGTKGEELSSQGQLDEASRQRTAKPA